MTDSMIERVERAIKDNIQAALPEGVTVDYRYAAIAAIEGMREPTSAMYLAKAHAHLNDGDEYSEMIDAALK